MAALAIVDKDDVATVPAVPAFLQPTALRPFMDKKNWLCWRWTLNGTRWTKPPMRQDGISPASVSDPATWTTYTNVLAANKREGLGVGLALQGLETLAVIDLDNVIGPDGDMVAWAAFLVEVAGSYTEYSPSGAGVKIFGTVTGDIPNKKLKVDGVELFHNCNSYVCVTGLQVEVSPAELRDITAIYKELMGVEGTKKAEEPVLSLKEGFHRTVDATTLQELGEALRYVDADDYDTWLRVGHALKTLGEDGWPVFNRYSKQSEKYNQHAVREKWERALTPNGELNVESIFYWAKQAGWKGGAKKKNEATPLQIIPPPALGAAIAPIEFLIDGCIPVGSLMLAGVRGGGKTTMLAALVVRITGCAPQHAELVPSVKRKVIWVTEDSAQIFRILQGMCKSAEVSDPELLWSRVKFVQADRRDAAQLAAALSDLGDTTLDNTFPRGVHKAEPLVILDTVSATLEIKEENSNSDVARAIAAVRVGLKDASVWFIHHVAKSMTRADVKAMTARGAGAFEANVQGTAILAVEAEAKETRFLVLDKTRFTPDFMEIKAERHIYSEMTSAIWGDRLQKESYVTLHRSSEEERKIIVEEAKEREDAAKNDARKKKVLSACSGLLFGDKAAEDKKGLVIFYAAGGRSPTNTDAWGGYKKVSLTDVRKAANVGNGDTQKEYDRIIRQEVFEHVCDHEGFEVLIATREFLSQVWEITP